MMEPQIIDWYNDEPQGVHIIDKLNDEYEEVIQKNKILKQKLSDYENIDTATDYLHELINKGIYNDITCRCPNRGVNCWKNYPLGTLGLNDSSINPMWDERWIGIKEDEMYEYDYCPYTDEGSPDINDIIKEGYEIKDILNIACPHKGVISNAAIIVPDKYSVSEERINLYKGTDLHNLYEFKASDVIKFYNKQIDTLPNKLIYNYY